MKSLFELYGEHQGKVSDKWAIYLSEYDRLFSSYRNQPVNMLEIGIQNGGSLEIWSKYFENAQALVGCDINPDCAKLCYDNPHINIVVGDANTDLTEAEIVTRSPKFDIIIDDGSHKAGDIIKSFARYFRHLNNGGIFVAEDLHCSYWENFEGGLYHPYSSISFFKRLADIINHEHWGVEKERITLLQGFAKYFTSDFAESNLAEVHSIEFFNSVCVIHKKSVQSNVLGSRFIAGQDETVVPGLLGLVGLSSTELQYSNKWTQMNLAPEEDWERLMTEVAERDSQISNLSQVVAERDSQMVNRNQLLAERDIQIASNNQITKELLAFHHSVINSTIWALSSPLRKIAPAKRFLKFLVDNPDKFSPTLRRLIKAQRVSGWLGLKQTIKVIPMEISDDNNWFAYQKRYGSIIQTQVNEQISGMTHKPLISVLLPTYETPRDILCKTLDSVIAQLYTEWELCIADDGSMQPHVRKILEAYVRRDKRIHLSFHHENTGVAAATNRALSKAKGEYCVLLDHDDWLEKQALFRVAESALANSPDMIYSDEVLLSHDGKKVINFVFRPAFSLELLRSHSYIVHMVAFRTALIRDIGGLDERLTISQDYDLILRVVEKSNAIVHIPEILYSWRQHPDSTGHLYRDKVMETSSKILSAHLARSGEIATVTPGKSFNFFEVRYPLEVGLRIAIIIPTKNHGELVRQCVESLERTIHDICYDIIVIDHESTDTSSLAYFAELGKRHRLLHYIGPFNFSAINNWAVSQIGDGYSHYLFCNNDIEAIEDGWLTRMLELGQKLDVGIVGAALLYPGSRNYQHAGVCVGLYGIAEHFAKFMDKLLPDGRIHPGYIGSLISNHELSAVTAACLLMRKDAFKAIKGYDETFAVGFGDVDLCLRSSEAGYRVLYCPHAELIHHESYTRGKSTGSDPHPLDSALFLRRWHSFLDTGDPYYNPNLSINNTYWGLKNPFEFSILLKNRIFLRPAQYMKITE